MEFPKSIYILTKFLVCFSLTSFSLADHHQPLSLTQLAEVVTAVRDDRDEESRLKVATASWFYRVFNRLVDSIQLQEGAGDFRLLSAPVVAAITQMREATRFSKGLMPWTGYRSVANLSSSNCMISPITRSQPCRIKESC